MRAFVDPMTDALILVSLYVSTALRRFIWVLKIEPTRLATRGKSLSTKVDTPIKAR